VSEYVQLESGEHRFEVREEDATISMLPGQNVEAGRLYTLYIIGKNDPEEEDHPVAIVLLPDVAAVRANADVKPESAPQNQEGVQ
jgi:hypothetical protein